ncbi:MAG: response regulator [Caldilinea sp.]|nr:response regulator [Caldilinea sp.]MDW8439235.1 response regulator [Caldilineaceae bacterium]
MPAKILLADDDPMLQKLIANTLKLEHHDVIVAVNGQEALDLIRSEKPDLVILDIMMPLINGFDVCAELRRHPETETLPVIMLSGLGQVQEKIMGLRAGADEYLTKPIDPRELLTRVEMLLERHRILRQSAVGKTGRVLSVLGAKGGVGVTTLAVNLAARLAQEHKNVILTEFRPDFGTVAVHFNLKSPASLAALRTLEPTAITEQMVNRLLVKTSAGVRVLCGPQSAGEFGSFAPGLGGALLGRLVTMCDYVIVDLPPLLDEAAELVLKSSEQVFLLIEPEITSVVAATHRLEQLAALSNTLTTRVIAVNRQGVMLLSLREIENRLGVILVDVLPSAADAMSIAVQLGVPLTISQAKHPYAERIAGLVKQLEQSRASALRSGSR